MKGGRKMKFLSFDNYKSFANAVLEECYNIRNGENRISIIAKYNDAREIIKELLRNDFSIAEIFELESPDCSGYTSEYIISICNFNGEYEIWCEPMKRDNEYIDDEAIITFILGDCSSRIISHCISQYKYDVHIGEEDDRSSLSCSGCDDESDLHSFSVSKNSDNGYYHFSFYTSENLSKKDINDILQSLKLD